MANEGTKVGYAVYTASMGILRWAGVQPIEAEWERGSGDSRRIGWRRVDGYRAIETNGDPVFESESGFDDAWEEARSLGSRIRVKGR